MNTVEPIRDLKKILAIKQLLRADPNPRNYLLFTIGVNSALRPSDILNLKVSDILDGKGNIKEYMYIIAKKTGKEQKIAINDAMKEAIEYYIEKDKPYSNEQYLFRAKRSGNKLDNVGLFYLIKKWAKAVDLDSERISGHSLRKTWGYQARKQGASIEQISEKLGHRSTRVTRRYIGINQEEINNLEKRINI
jgi:integrase